MSNDNEYQSLADQERAFDQREAEAAIDQAGKPAQDTELACQCADLGAGDVPVECGKPSVMKWTITVLGNPLLQDFHTCATHAELMRTGIVIKFDRLSRVSLATAGGLVDAEGRPLQKAGRA